MADFQRILSYLYAYHQGEKGECKGFIKAEVRHEQLKATVQVKDVRWQPGMTLSLQLYRQEKEALMVKKAGDLTMEESGEVITDFPREPAPELLNLQNWDGVILTCQDALLYGSVWKGEALPVGELSGETGEEEKIVLPESSAPEEANPGAPQAEAAETEAAGEAASSESLQPDTDTAQRVIHPDLAGGRKISLEELPWVCGENSGLEENAFLRRGYEKFHYLITGSVLYAGGERLCVGVPGVYENKERYMAQQYGFGIFLPLTDSPIKTGSVGYWLGFP